MRTVPRALILLLAAAGLSACGVFGGKDDEELEPAELVDFEQTLPVKRLWSSKVGKGTEFLRLSLAPASDGGRLYTASFDGVVTAFDPEDGDRIWRVETDTELGAGPGAGDGRVVVLSREGEAIALDAANGQELWRAGIRAESVAAPLIRDDIVVVMGIDGRLSALSAFDGTEVWAIEYPPPALTLRGNAAPALVGTNVVAGFDNGRLVAVDLDEGIAEWEVMLSPPSGRSDLERLSDVDGAIAVVGQDVYAAGYQGRVAALAAESGQALWSREISSYAGIGADWERVYTLSEDGEVIALSRRSGNEVWRQGGLLRREPTAPVPFHTTVVVGDFEGYVHFFDAADGRPVARVRVGKGMISGKPLAVGDRLYVQSESGQLAAFGVPLPEPAEDADASADPD